MLKRRIVICLLGFVLIIVSFSILIQMDVYLTRANQSPGERLLQTVWRTDYLYIPIVVAVVSLVVSFLDRSRYKFLLVFITLLPFLVFVLAAGSFSIRAFLFFVCYLGLASVVAWSIPNRAKGT